MNIVTKDTRELKDVAPINFQAKQIIFYEMKITWNFAWDIEDMVQWNFYFVWKKSKKYNLTFFINLSIDKKIFIIIFTSF